MGLDQVAEMNWRAALDLLVLLGLGLVFLPLIWWERRAEAWEAAERRRRFYQGSLDERIP